MSPILTRPVREQFEHDRIIRLLQVRYKRKFEVIINPGPEQNAFVLSGELPMYPDLLLYSPERGRRLEGTVEVETGESVNTLEAMAEWGPFGRFRVPFSLYVPTNSLDTARRLCVEHKVEVAEIWTYHTAIDQVRFTLVHRAPESQVPRPKAARPETKAAPAEKKAAARPAPKAATKAAAKKPAARKPAARKPARPAKPAKPVKGAKKSAPPKGGKAKRR